MLWQRNILTFLLVLINVCPLFAADRVERTADRKVIAFPDLIDDVKKTQLVFIGEVHDDRDHHQFQLDVIKGLRDAGARIAIGVEMFSDDWQPSLDRWVEGKIPLMDFVDIYQRNWTIPWPCYDALFLFARNNRIPIIALNPPKEVVQKVFRQGFASLEPNERKLLPEGITCEVDTSYRRFIRSMFADHGTDPERFDRFCEAQLVRNRTMARHLADYVAKNPGVTVVVISGIGHSIRRGVPDEAARMGNYTIRVVMPRLQDESRSSIRTDDSDYFALP
ncbi:MAG: ChaN family lipoprotein [Geobacter sp.]|nr:ChaN family lipoprotein [Geobacter sp.]